MTQRRIYQCAFPYHITFNILHREWFFDDETKAKLLHEIILNAGDIKNHVIYQFCIMPDHVHLLCRPNDIPATGHGLCGFKSVKNTAGTEGKGKNPAGTEIGKNPAGTEAPQCFSGWDDSPTARHLRVRDGGVCVRDEYDLGILLKPNDVPKTITNFMHSIKSYFVREIRDTFDIEYKFLQNRFNYRIVTTDKQLLKTIAYISFNPIKANLPEKWQKHPYQYKNDELIEQLFR